MADPINPNTPRDTTTTQASYHAEAVRVAPTGTHTATDHVGDTESSAAKKGLIVGVLTFLALCIGEWLMGPGNAAGSALDSLTFWPEVVIYALVGVIVGWLVKMIAKR